MVSRNHEHCLFLIIQDLYIFGFSRGAYTARYLAEMLDYIGLLEAGNEELVSLSGFRLLYT